MKLLGYTILIRYKHDAGWSEWLVFPNCKRLYRSKPQAEEALASMIERKTLWGNEHKIEEVYIK